MVKVRIIGDSLFCTCFYCMRKMEKGNFRSSAKLLQSVERKHEDESGAEFRLSPTLRWTFLNGFDHHGILAPISFARAFRYIDFDT